MCDLENRMVVGDSDEYERRMGDRRIQRKRPRLGFDMTNGFPQPTLEDDDNGDDALDRRQQRSLDEE